MRNELPLEIGLVASSFSLVAASIENKTDELATAAYNDRQRRWVRDRDDNQCQFPVVVSDESYRPCGSRNQLQVHHAIVPQRLALDLGLEPADWDVKNNGITLCKPHHVGVIHPDMVAANLARPKNAEAFTDMFQNRQMLLQRGEPYWNTNYDEFLERIINARNARFEPEHPFPLNRKQQKKIESGEGLMPLPTVPERDALLLERKFKSLFGIADANPEPSPDQIPGISHDVLDQLFKRVREPVKVR